MRQNAALYGNWLTRIQHAVVSVIDLQRIFNGIKVGPV